MVVAKDVMLAVPSAAEWDARTAAWKGTSKVGLMVDSKVGWRESSRVVSSAADLESWLVGRMVASMAANWVALSDTLSVVVMVDWMDA